MKGLVYDGEKNRFIEIKKAAVPLTDLAVQRAFGVKEDIKIHEGRPFALRVHLDRLMKSLRIVGMKNHPSRGLIERKVAEGLKKISGKGVWWLKIIVTGGDSKFLLPQGHPRLYIAFQEGIAFPEKYYKKGITVMTSPFQRTLPLVKSLDYFGGVLAHAEAARKGYDEALFVDDRGRILEGTTFNFAIVKGNEIWSARDKVLDGITMNIVLDLAGKRGFKVKRRNIAPRDLKTADEAFITSVYREVVPVVRVDRTKIAAGRPGPVTRTLMAAYGRNV